MKKSLIFLKPSFIPPKDNTGFCEFGKNRKLLYDLFPLKSQQGKRTFIMFCWGSPLATLDNRTLWNHVAGAFLDFLIRILSPNKNSVCLMDVGYCQAQFQLAVQCKFN